MPQNGFRPHVNARAHNKKQQGAMLGMNEKLRQMQIHFARKDIVRAHDIFNDLVRQVRGCGNCTDLQLRDVADGEVSAAFEKMGVLTLSDLANCEASKLPGKVNVLSALRLSLALLRRVVEIESRRQEFGV